MSPPVFSIAGEEEGKSNVTLLVSSSAMECAHMESSELKVRNYMELSGCSSADSSVSPLPDEHKKAQLSLMRNLFSPAKAAVLGNKRGFLDVMNGFQKSWGSTSQNERSFDNKKPHAFNESRPSLNGSANNNSSAPATKAGRKRWTTGVNADLLHGSEYVLTYEDRDNDSMGVSSNSFMHLFSTSEAEQGLFVMHGEPVPTNKRHNAAKIFSHPYIASQEPWYI
ncbi:hypothetical protein Ahy_B04g071586 isoform A [Arachis hypogaea]|uniref:Auxin-induced protein n=1 Tax=Arachis hypogaea TaxID=3818 RepID=A0A444ZL30_ARAHY|nr:hypothetical protein Ahy_B04g071586 isoform A [Arachis hypogaea]